ncbi:MAG: T9SS type A sorting domain-containing protein [Bacteroidia bacterium]
MSQSVFDRISIPKPCHEDWNRMTPNEQGAFCKVCNKSVHDFSTKKAEEVEAILLNAEEGKICGRFSMEQIPVIRDLEIPLYLIPKNMSPFKAFALAVFLVFGTALFGITDAFGQGMKGKVCIKKEAPKPVIKEPEVLLGDVSYVPKPVKITEPSKCTKTKGEVIFRKPETKDTILKPVTVIRTQVQGGVKYSPLNTKPPVQVKPVQSKPDTLPSKEMFMMGKASLLRDTPPTQDIPSPTVDTVKPEAVIKNDTPETLITGQLTICTVVPKADTISEIGTAQSFIQQQPEENNGSVLKEKISCYPNPTTGATVLAYSVKRKTDVSAEVYDAEGRMVRLLFQMKDHYEGAYQSTYDFSNLKNGAYLIRVLIGQEVYTTRFILSH